MAGSLDGSLVYPHKVGLASHIRNGNFGEVCRLLPRSWQASPRPRSAPVLVVRSVAARTLALGPGQSCNQGRSERVQSTSEHP